MPTASEPSPAADEAPASPAPDTANPDPDPDHRATRGGASTTPTTGVARFRAWVKEHPGWTAPAALGAVIVMVLVISAIAGDDGEPDTRRPPPSSPPTTIEFDPVQVCIDDHIGILRSAAPPGTTEDAAFRNILTVYGSSDQRTQFMTQAFAFFQSDVYQYGQVDAELRLTAKVEDWCRQTAFAFYDGTADPSPNDGF